MTTRIALLFLASLLATSSLARTQTSPGATATRTAPRAAPRPDPLDIAPERVLRPRELWADIDADGLLDLYVVRLDRRDRLLRNRGDGHFEDVTETWRVGDRSGSLLARFADYDQDGRLDLFIAGSGSEHTLLHNVGGMFEDVSGAAGLAAVGELREMSWLDYDADGHPDMQLITREGELRFLHNTGAGTFEDVTIPSHDDERGENPRAHDHRTLLADYDRDGRLDFYALTNAGESRLYRGGVDGRFEDRTESAGVSHSGTDRTASWFDYDGDQHPDLRVLTDQNALLVYHNLGNGTFETVTLSDGPGHHPPAPHGGSSGYPKTGTDPRSRSREEDAADDSPHGMDRTSPGRGPGKADRQRNGNITSSGDPTVDELGPKAVCPDRLKDQAFGGCLTASSVPVVGSLYPLGRDLFVDPTGRVGLGTLTPLADLHIAGNSGISLNASDNLLVDDSQDQVVINGTSAVNANSTLTVHTSRTSGFGGMYVNTTGSAALPFYGYATAGSASAWHWLDGTTSDWHLDVGGTTRLTATDTFEVGINTVTPRFDLEIHSYSGAATMAITPNAASSGSSSFYLYEDNNLDFGMFLHYDGVNDELGVFKRYKAGQLQLTGGPYLTIETNGDVGIGIDEPDAKLDVEGDIRAFSMVITAGADLVEGFDTGSQHCEPGTVVVIDAEHPGQLTRSTEAYDTRVAGVVSGAGGIAAGLRMGQDGVCDGDTLVAMTGRVYVRCSTENGGIRAGDLLTTASLPGHAMKATDAARSHGTVLGKAMTELDDGTGLVLVLVNLQ